MTTMISPSSSSPSPSTSHHHTAHCSCGHHSAGGHGPTHTTHHHHSGQSYSYSQSDFDLLKALTSTSTSKSSSSSNNNGFAARRALAQAQSQSQNKSTTPLRRPQLDPLILETAAHSGPHITRNHFLHEFYPHPEDPSSAFSRHPDLYRRPGYGSTNRPAYADCDIGPADFLSAPSSSSTSSNKPNNGSKSGGIIKQQQPALNNANSANLPRAVEESTSIVSENNNGIRKSNEESDDIVHEASQGPSIYKSRQAPRKIRLERERRELQQEQQQGHVLEESNSNEKKASTSNTDLTALHTNLKDINPTQKLETDLGPSTDASISLQDSIFHPHPIELPKTLKKSLQPSFFDTFTAKESQATVAALGLSTTNKAAAGKQEQSPPPPLQVVCFARTRVPTPHGEVFLHLYKNNWDDKEHLAFVFDRDQLESSASNSDSISTSTSTSHTPPQEAYGTLRSKSLDAVWRDGETDIERIVRGAYVGRLSSTTANVSRPRASSRSSSSSPSATTTTTTQAHSHIEMTDSGNANEPVLIRIHSECFTGETIGSQRCDCGEQLDEAFRLINTSSSGLGIIIYLRQEGRGIGLLEKIKAYNLQDLGHDTVTANLLLGHSADLRNYSIASEMLRDLGITDRNGVRLLTNNPDKIDKIEKEGIKVVERVPMVPRGWTVQIPKILLQSSSKKKKDKRRNKVKNDTPQGTGTASRGERQKVLKKKKQRPQLETKDSTLSIQSIATSQNPLLLSPALPINDAGTTTTASSNRKARNKVLEALRSKESGSGSGNGGLYDSDGIRSLEASASEAEVETDDYFEDDAADSYGVQSMTGSVGDDERQSDGVQPEEDDNNLDGEEDDDDNEDEGEDDDEEDSDTDDSAEREEALEDYLISMNRTGVGMIGAGLTQSKELEKYLKTKIERMGHMLVAPATPPSTPLPLRRNARFRKNHHDANNNKESHRHGHSKLSSISNASHLHPGHGNDNDNHTSNMQDSIISFKTDEESIACDAGPDCEDCQRQKLQEGYFDQDDAYGEDMFG